MTTPQFPCGHARTQDNIYLERRKRAGKDGETYEYARCGICKRATQRANYVRERKVETSWGMPCALEEHWRMICGSGGTSLSD